MIIEDFPVSLNQVTTRAECPGIRDSQSRCASSLGGDAVSAGIRAGVPVIIWCRDKASAATFQNRLRAFLSLHRVADLPEFVQNLRRESLQVGDPVGSHITLIWDLEDDPVF